ncbi:MAG: helix-turn-helix domain-containing protein [Ruminococcaceae bacterium]|nr:helix-turn-helix domain-containing protein [Oscillospiraceae bacterium]
MDSKTIGVTIAKLRRQNGMTQTALAEKLSVSNKAVSKWESGQGYPDITLFPKIAEIFGVSVDYLMLGEEKGITIAGTTLVDIVKNIDRYPEAGMLVHINDINYAVGGCLPNTAINLAKIDRRIPISVIGKVGNDENGRYIVSTLQKYGINVSKMCYTSQNPTSFCDVMSIPSGERTFFHKKGANAEFCPDDIDINSLNCNIFHIGYVLLLDRFDEDDKQYGTKMARFLSETQKAGIKTSIDLVSDSSGNYGKKVIPVLKYCNYVIINEIECCGIWNVEPRFDNGKINEENVRLAMQKCIDAGVRDKVVVHCKECSFALDPKGRFTTVASLKVPREDIKGTVGAGDAFCAGCLYGIYNNYADSQMLEFASAAAACNLLEANAVDGMKPRNEILMLAEKYGRLTL